jgi:transposase
MDQAPCHRAKKVKTFVQSQKRLHVFYLPPRSPEYNPDEKVWNHLKHHELKSHGAKTTEELRKLTHRKLKSMAKKSAQNRWHIQTM